MAQSTFQRYELKYLMTTGQQQGILAAMEPHMEPDQFSTAPSATSTWTPPTSGSSARSLEKPVYKEKLRVRSYGRAQAGDRCLWS